MEGKNLLSVPFSKTASSILRSNINNFKPGTYTFSFDMTTLEGNQITARKIVNGQTTQITYAYNSKSLTFTLDEMATLQLEVYKVGIELSDISNIMLEKGTVATPYAPYNSIGIKVENKNLFIYDKETQTIDGVKFTINEDKSITANGSASRQIYLKTGELYLPKDGTYYMSGSPSNGSASTYRVVGYLHDENGEYLSAVIDTGTGASFSGNKGYRLDYYIYIANGIIVKDIVFKPMISKVLTSYEPHKEQTVYFPLQEGQKLYEGSYLTDDGIHNVRGQVILDGSEIWAYTSKCVYTNAVQNIIKKVSNDKVANILCDYYLKDTLANCYNNVNDKRISVNNQGFVYIYDSSFTSANDFKTWLSTHNITAEYELEEPEIIPYTPEQQEAYNQLKKLPLYRYVNHITLLANEETNMTLNYKQDLQSQIAEMTQAIVALGGVV